MRYSASPLLIQKLPARRSRLLLCLFLSGFVLMIARAFYLQDIRKEFLLDEGQSRFERVLDIPPTRGRITDRNGDLLAMSTPVRSVWAAPGRSITAREQLKSLSRILGLSTQELDKTLNNKRDEFIYLRRQMDPQSIQAITDGEFPGIYAEQEYRRYYPMADVAAQVVGFTGVDGRGLEGVELALNKNLGGQSGKRRVIRDRLGRIIEDVQFLHEPKDGEEVTLSLDSRIQFAAFRHLKDTVTATRAQSGAAIVIDVQSGEILAIANWPTYNPNSRGDLKGPSVRNRALTDQFEPGSTMKPFTVALALEQGLYKPDSLINTDKGKFTIDKYTISDVVPHGTLTLSEVIQKSSNVAMAKIAKRLSAKQMGENLQRLGFGLAPPLGFPGVSPGTLPPWKSWNTARRMTVSYGYGMSASLVQLAQAYLCFARDGDIPPITLMRGAAHVDGRAIFKPETARAIRNMLFSVTEIKGTGHRAQIDNINVAGKTGTAQKLKNGAYSEDTLVSFIGFAPVESPRLLVAVMVDSPKVGHFAGEVAAPAFSRIMADSLKNVHQPPATMEAGVGNTKSVAITQPRS